MGATPARPAGLTMHWVPVTDATGTTAMQMRWSASPAEGVGELPVDPTEVAARPVPRVTPAA